MKKGASIVNIASIAGEKGCGGAVYVSSKAAVIGVTKHTALRFQDEGIRCNAICPGTIVTPMVAGTTAADMDPDMMGAMATHSNLKRHLACQRILQISLSSLQVMNPALLRDR